jgi:hypothetical protein
VGATLAQQVPVTVELDLDGAQALVLLVGEPLLTLAGAPQFVLFGYQRLDVILDPSVGVARHPRASSVTDSRSVSPKRSSRAGSVGLHPGSFAR